MQDSKMGFIYVTTEEMRKILIDVIARHTEWCETHQEAEDMAFLETLTEKERACFIVWLSAEFGEDLGMRFIASTSKTLH